MNVVDVDNDMKALRAEWRNTIKDIDGHVRRLDAGLQIDSLHRASGEAARRWRLMLVAWRDELMDLLRDHPTPAHAFSERREVAPPPS